MIPADKKWFRNLAIGGLLLDALRGHGPVRGRRPTSTSTSSAGAWTRRTRSTVIPTVAVTRYVTPLREGGSLPGIVEGDDLGTYVCKFRGAGQGAAGAGRRGDRRRAGPADRAATPRAWWPSTSTPRSPATRPTRRSRTCSTPAPASTSASTSCPARSGTTGSCTGDGAEAARVLWLDALLRQRRPLLAQPQPAGLARRPVGHRPRRQPLLPPRAGAAASATPSGSPRSRGTRPTTCCSTGPGGSARSTSELTARIDEHALVEVVAQVPDAWLEPVPGAETPDAQRAAYVALPHRPAPHPRSGSRRRRACMRT